MQLPFDLPTSNESLACFPAFLFGETSHPTLDEATASLAMSARSSIDSLTPILWFTASDPSLPDDFLYRFSLLSKYLGAPSIPASHARDGVDNYWLDWRARLAKEERAFVDS